MTNDNKAGTASANVENLLTSLRNRRLQFVNLHGLFRGFDQELGADTDTGGQTKYVWDLAQALAEMGVEVDIFTRLFEDCDSSYSVPTEEHGNVRIIRISCGGTLYLRKELLWPVLQEAVNGIIAFNDEQGIHPFAFHGHYAESGEIAKKLALHYAVPFVFTGHSFGKDKKKSLQVSGKNMAEAEAFFNLERRIGAETTVLQQAVKVVCNSRLEIEGQVSLYGKTLVSKCCPIPPGVSSNFFPYWEESDGEAESRMKQLVAQQLRSSEKPLILAIARPEPKKNLRSLLEAYGQDAQLQEMANVAIFAGTRRDITNPSETSPEVRAVIVELLEAVDRFDLYGKVALPKQHSSADVPALYRLAARLGGVFVNPARIEPFGFTALEAARTGLPVVVTSNGGPPEIIANCNNGLLVDPQEVRQIATALRLVLGERDRWEMYSRNGVQGVERHYSWQAHCQKYLELLAGLVSE